MDGTKPCPRWRKWIRRCAVALLVAILLFLVYFIIVSAMGGIPSVFGYSMLRIVTPSMEPTIPVGTYILISSTEAEDIREGDIITFYTDDPNPTIAGYTVTHRVKSVTVGTDGSYEFETKGDNNPSSDAYPARGETVFGVYKRTLFVMTALGNLFRTKTGFVVAVLIPGLFLMQYGVRDITKQMKKNRMNALVAAEVEKMKKEKSDTQNSECDKH